MRTGKLLLVAASLLALFTFAERRVVVPTALAQVAESGDHGYLPGQVVVKLAPKTDLVQFGADFGLDPTPLKQFGSRPIYQLRILDGTDPQVKSTQLAADLVRVVYAEPNYEFDAPEETGIIWSVGDAYTFVAGGFYSHREPPADVPMAKSPVEDLGRLPAVCRYSKDDDGPAGLRGEIMMHAWLSHAGKEYKRLLCAAESFWRSLDLGHMPKTGALATPLGQRGALLLTLAGLLEFPADQNYLDALWASALKQLNLPDISRSVVRACITEADHNASNYYGSLRGLTQLIGDGKTGNGDLGRADALAYSKLKVDDASVGRATMLVLEAKPLVA